MYTVSHELLAAHTFRFSPLGAQKSVQLSAAQQAVVHEFLNPTSKDLQVVAGAGAGKTATIVESVTQVLASGWCREDEILLISFSANARESLQKKLSRAINNTKSTIQTFASYGLLITGADNAQCTDRMTGGSSTMAWMAAAEAQVGGNLQPWENTFISGGDDEEEESTSSKLVLELTRLHSRGILVTDPEFAAAVQDHTVRQILQTFDLLIKQRGFFTYGQNAIEALRKLRNTPKEAIPYKLVIVDEAQDNDVVQLEMAEILAQNGRLVLVGDPRQCIHRWRGAEPDFFIDFAKRATTRVMHLTDNYRSHDEIVAFGNAVASHMPRSASVTKPMTSSSPCVSLYFARYGQVASRIAMQARIAPLQHDQIAVLARTWKPLWTVFRRLLTAGIRTSFKKFPGWDRSTLLQMAPIWNITALSHAQEADRKKKFMYEMAIGYLENHPNSSFQDFLDIAPIRADKNGRTQTAQHGPTVRLSTIQSVKGEEFDQVWLLDTGVSPRCLPGTSPEEREALEEDELRIYYTGVTRAKQRLILVDGVPGPDYKSTSPSWFHGALRQLFRTGSAMHPRIIPKN